jgi:hypothetical protein
MNKPWRRAHKHHHPHHHVPLGVRLNNPLCIKSLGNFTYKGEIVPSSDKVFRQFSSAIDGFRAGVELLRAYQKDDHILTIGQAIARYAPVAAGNPTATYIQNVCNAVGVKDNVPIDFNAIMPGMLKAIAVQEDGGWFYDEAILLEAIALAGT